MRKFYWVLLIMLLFTIFTSCIIDTKKTRTKKGIAVNVGHFEINRIKGNLLIWQSAKCPTKTFEDDILYPTKLWFFYSTEAISEDIVGCKIKMHYRVAELVHEVPIMELKKIEILKKKKEKT